MTVFAIDRLPGFKFGSFGVENQPVEIEDKGFEHDGIILSIVMARRLPRSLGLDTSRKEHAGLLDQRSLAMT